jgi:hypothetical protein
MRGGTVVPPRTPSFPARSWRGRLRSRLMLAGALKLSLRSWASRRAKPGSGGVSSATQEQQAACPGAGRVLRCGNLWFPISPRCGRGRVTCFPEPAYADHRSYVASAQLASRRGNPAFGGRCSRASRRSSSPREPGFPCEFRSRVRNDPAARLRPARRFLRRGGRRTERRQKPGPETLARRSRAEERVRGVPRQ